MKEPTRNMQASKHALSPQRNQDDPTLHNDPQSRGEPQSQGGTQGAQGNTQPAQPEPNASRSVLKTLLLLALPTFGQLIADPIFVMIDTAIVGHVSDTALAGLSLGSTIILTAVGLCVFLAYATTSQVARLLGAGKRREGLQAGMDGLWLSTGIGIVLAAVLLIFAEPLCFALGGRGENLQLAVVYAQLAALGVPGMLLVYAANGIFRGLQKVGITFVAATAGAVLNTVLDIVFVIVLGWGIAGSGLATCIAQWFMGIFLLVPAIRWALQSGARWQPLLTSIAKAGGDGLPLFLRTLALRTGLVATVMAAASMGTEMLAAYQIVNSIWNFAVNALDSIAIAGQTLVGAELGARNRKQARQLTRETERAGLIVGAIVGALFALAGLFAPALFSPNADIQVLAAAGMVVVGIGMPLQGWMWALDGILIGAGDYRYLADACATASGVHIIALCVLVFAICPLLAGDLARIVALWVVFDVVLMGIRGAANGRRARTDAWMK